MVERVKNFERPIDERIGEYLLPKDILSISPSPIDLKRREEYKKHRPSCDWAMVMYENRLVIVPAWHPLNTTAVSANSTVYGTGSMETLTLEPETDMHGEVVGGNIVLLPDRMDRLYDRALPPRGVDCPVSKDVFAQGIKDYMAVVGDKVVRHEQEIGKGSVRVIVIHGIEKYGKSAVDQSISISVESYFDNDQDLRNGICVAAGPDQRTEKFLGKHSSHYGEGGRIGKVAKKIGAKDAIVFAPFKTGCDEEVCLLSQFESNPEKLLQNMLELALADGLGAEILAVRSDGTLLLPPMDVNRLGGVTANYIVNHLAKRLGIPVEMTTFNLHQVTTGEIVGLFFSGNHARVTPLKKIILHDGQENILQEIDLNIPDSVIAILNNFEAEVAGVIAPSHPSILTHVDTVSGSKARKTLEDAFPLWI